MFASGTSGLATTANHPARRLGPTSSVGASCSGRSYVIAHAPPVSHAGGRNRVFARSRISVGATSRATTAGAFPLSEPRRDGAKKPRIVVAGGGIGGLVFAAAALSKVRLRDGRNRVRGPARGFAATPCGATGYPLPDCTALHSPTARGGVSSRFPMPPASRAFSSPQLAPRPPCGTIAFHLHETLRSALYPAPGPAPAALLVGAMCRRGR